jgi:chromosome segregation ATPase
MSPAQLDTLIETLATFDKRLSSMDGRFASVESSLAEDAQATDEAAKSMDKLRDLYLSIDSRLENLESLLSNYVEETKGLRLTSRSLISEVREKLKASSG